MAFVNKKLIFSGSGGGDHTKRIYGKIISTETNKKSFLKEIMVYTIWKEKGNPLPE